MERKRGRPTTNSYKLGEGFGMYITPEIRTLLIAGYQRFYLGATHPSWRHAYYLILSAYFAVGYERDPSGHLQPVIPPRDERPSFGQFCYWAKKSHAASAPNATSLEKPAATRK